MKRFFFIAILLIMAIPAFHSCKKGENDPLLSFKSRDARLMTKWKLVKIESTETSLAGSVTTSININYDGTNYTKVTTITGNPTETVSATGTYFMTMEKYGVMTWEETYTDGNYSDIQTRTGKWSWGESDKAKSSVNIEAGNHFIKGGNWLIDRLATKELWLYKKGSSGINANSATWEGTWYFEKD